MNRVILARDWHPGLEYAVNRRSGEALVHVVQLGEDTVWSSGLPVWATLDTRLVVREATS